jgi:hypothetical protein
VKWSSRMQRMEGSGAAYGRSTADSRCSIL